MKLNILNRSTLERQIKILDENIANLQKEIDSLTNVEKACTYLLKTANSPPQKNPPPPPTESTTETQGSSP